MPVEIHLHVSARSNFCVCVVCIHVGWGGVNREELGSVALSGLSERSLRHCWTALYRISPWSQ